MSGISHQQAIQLIHRRLDGLLNESQLLALEEHLRSCDECSTYASEMELLPLHLRHEFHTRWDKKPGPSQNVMEHITTKARNIPATNRISSGVKLFAGAMMLIILGIAINFVISRLQSSSPGATATDSPDSSPLAEHRLLAFTSDQNGNLDIYTMHADGTGLTNLTDNPARDSNPVWSPDGKYIAFESDRDGFVQIYRMDADGSNVFQLTREEADHRLPLNRNGTHNPWAPDGSRLLFLQEGAGKDMNTLYSIDINGENKITLANGRISLYDVSWSPGGQHIAYLLDISPTPDKYIPDIYVVEPDGSNDRELKKLLPAEKQSDFIYSYYWSSNGQSIFLLASATNSLREAIYQLDLQTNTFLNETETKLIVTDWREGGSLIQDINQEGMPYVWERSDGTSNTFEASKAWDTTYDPSIASAAPCSLDLTRSTQNNFAFGVYCPDAKFNLYWTNSDGSIIKQLLTLPTDVDAGGVGEIAWSPDDQYIAFNITSADKTEMYVVNVEEFFANPSSQPLHVSVSTGEGNGMPSWQPRVDENLTKELQTPQPTSTSSPEGLVAFTSEQNGNLDIYTVHPDGSGLTNLTNNAAKDYSPTWSPDGTHIAFVSDRDGNDNIYVINFDGTNVVQLTDDEASDSVPLWSPDGTKIAYMSGSFIKKNTNIHVVDLNGQNHQQLTNYAPGTTVVSHAWSPDSQYILFDVNFRIAQINANGGDITPVAPPTKTITPYYLMSKDSSILSYLTDCEDIKTFCYELRLAYRDGTHQESSTGFKTLKTPELCELKQTATWTGTFVKWSPDQSKILFAFTCEESGWFYISNADGSDFKPLTNYPILGNMPQNDVATFDWSSDSQSIVFMSALDKPEHESLYILNVNETLQNPELRPTSVNTSISQISSLAWQPNVTQDIVEQKPTPAKTPLSTPPIDHRLIAFTSEQSENSDIYTMHGDGSGMTNITNNPANDYSPIWSWDGKRILFISERTGNTDIFSMDPDGSHLTQLTDNPGYDGFFSLSPNGERIIYLSSSDNDSNLASLVIMNADGSNKVKLTDPGSYIFLGWSPDGQKIVYLKQTSEKVQNDEIHVSDIDGKNHYAWNAIIDEIKWEDEQHFIGYGWSGQSEPPTWKLYRFSSTGTPPVEIASHSSRIVALYDHTHVVEGAMQLTWYAMDGNPAPLKSWDVKGDCTQRGDQYFQETGHAISPDERRVFITVYCNYGYLQFYFANEDGSELKQLTDFSVETSSVFGGVWSPDGNYVLMTIANKDDSKTNFYLFDIEKMLNDPSTQPIQLTTDGASKYDIVWQPMP